MSSGFLTYGSLALALLLAASPVFADSYLVESTIASAQTRSQSQCQANGCDGAQTIYWWESDGGPGHVGGFVPPTALQAVVTIKDSGAYSTQGLSASEQSALQTAAQLQTAGWTVPASALP